MSTQPAESLPTAIDEAPENPRDLSMQIGQMLSKLGRAASEAISDVPRPTSSALDEQSKTEHEVLELLIQGLNTKEIAAHRVTSEQSVKSHLKHLYSKLDVRGRTEAVIAALEAQDEQLLNQRGAKLRKAATYLQAASILTELNGLLPEIQADSAKADMVVLRDVSQLQDLSETEDKVEDEIEPSQNSAISPAESDVINGEYRTVQERLVDVLGSNIGQPLTYIELGKLVYPNEDLDNSILYTRIATNVCKYWQRIEVSLLEKDLVLQKTESRSKAIRIHTGKLRKTLALVAELRILQSDGLETDEDLDAEPRRSFRESETQTRPIRRLAEYRWEPQLRHEVANALKLLEKRGLIITADGDSDTPRVKVGNHEALKVLFENGLISREELGRHHVKVPAAIAAILLRTAARLPLLSESTAQFALDVIKDEVELQQQRASYES